MFYFKFLFKIDKNYIVIDSISPLLLVGLTDRYGKGYINVYNFE